MRVTIIPSEHQEQVKLIQWLKLKKLHYNATPNGEKRHISVAKRLKAEGVSKGYPDINVYTPSKMLCIELKRVKGGRVSPEQREWIKYLNGLPYVEAKICKGFEEAREFIEGWL